MAEDIMRQVAERLFSWADKAERAQYATRVELWVHGVAVTASRKVPGGRQEFSFVVAYSELISVRPPIDPVLLTIERVNEELQAQHRKAGRDA